MQCNFCQNFSQQMKQCSRCKQVFYCSQSCQKKDWDRKHKTSCFDKGQGGQMEVKTKVDVERSPQVDFMKNSSFFPRELQDQSVLIIDDLAMTKPTLSDFGSLISNCRRVSTSTLLTLSSPLCYGCGQPLTLWHSTKTCSKARHLRRNVDLKFVFKDESNPQSSQDLVDSLKAQGYQTF